MEQQKYSVLLVNEEKLLEGGYFTEIKGVSQGFYQEINAKCKKVIKLLYMAKIVASVCAQEQETRSYNYAMDSKKAEEMFVELLELYAGNLQVHPDFLRMLVMMYIAREKGNQKEKEYASKVVFLEDIPEVKDLAEKYLCIINTNNLLQQCIENRITWNIKLERIKLFLEIYVETKGLHSSYLREVNNGKLSVYKRVDNFYSAMQKIAVEEFDADTIFEIIEEANIDSNEVSDEVYKIIRKKRSNPELLNIDDCKSTMDNYLDTLKKEIEKEILHMEDDETYMSVKELAKFCQERFSNFIYKSKLYMDSYYEIAEKYIHNNEEFKNIKKKYDKWVTTLRTYIDGLVGIELSEMIFAAEEIKFCFSEFDFKKLKKTINDLELALKEEKRDKIVVEVNRFTGNYRHLRKAFRIVMVSAFDELYNEIKYINGSRTGIADCTKDEAKVRRQIKEVLEGEEEKIEGTNRFYFLEKEPTIGLMTYSYPGKHDSEYKRGAIIFDADKADFIISESKKSGWSMKESRGGTGSDKFGNGQYLLAAGNKKILMCELFKKRGEDGKIIKYENSDISKIKTEANYYNREGSLFDFREKSVIEMDKPQKIDAKSYGKLGVITEETAEQLVNFNWREEKEGAGVLYIDSAEELSKYILSL